MSPSEAGHHLNVQAHPRLFCSPEARLFADELGLKTSENRLIMGIRECKEQISYSVLYFIVMQV